MIPFERAGSVTGMSLVSGNLTTFRQPSDNLQTGFRDGKWSGAPEAVAACLEIPRSRVQDPTLSSPGIPWFNFPDALVNSQLVCLRPVVILNSCCCCVVPSFR